MNINCINNKIANANGVLQPIILQAIKEIYINGNHQMNALMVRNHCIILNNNNQWNSRLPAVCNAMRNSIECGGIIIGEDRNFLDFTIAFDGNSNNNLDKSKNNANLKGHKVDSIVNNKKTIKSQNNQKATQKKIEELKKLLDWKKLKDKKTPKLLIIGCSNAKSQQPNNLANGGIENYNFGDAINISRGNKLNIYTELNANHFNNIARGNQAYFMHSLNNQNRRNALDVYGNNQSPFYNPAMKALYRDKIANSGLHLLIISGLYGVLRHDDYINDYHLKINNGANVWGNSISNAVSEYVCVNNIDNDAVFYSLSVNYLGVLAPNPQWNNLWIRHDRGRTSANFLKDSFLDQL